VLCRKAHGALLSSCKLPGTAFNPHVNPCSTRGPAGI